MTRDEFERLRRRFGGDPTAWPAPYRKQARTISGARTGLPSGDDALDRLVVDAASMDTDDEELARQVLARIDTGHDIGFGSFLSGVLLRPTAATACAALIFAALAVGGYRMAASQAGPADVQFLALALGSPMGDGLLDLSADDGAEGAL